MRLLRLAVESQRWDLAAHTLVLATARFLSGAPVGPNEQGGKRNAGKRRGEKRSAGKTKA
ncbi:MAG: hypothetical protein HY530_01005 [Chloroflexi bacterium]|nr:hypothetical protein [Chloroflexota bacterium]